MSESYDFGKQAEQQAADFLVEKGYRIVARNYRFDKAEIDIVALKDGTLAIVEVKARHSLYFGTPESFISPKKIELLIKAAHQFTIERNLDLDIRFDVISVSLQGKRRQIHHLENAFNAY